jgi:uncharacterized membrane protein
MLPSIVGGLAFLAIFGVAVFVLFFVITRVTRVLFGSNRRLEAAFGLETLKARRRRGEITTEEFEQARRALGA